MCVFVCVLFCVSFVFFFLSFVLSVSPHFQMRSSICIRGCVRPSVHPSRTSWISENWDIWAEIEQNSIEIMKLCHFKDYSGTSTRAERQNASDVWTPTDLFFYVFFLSVSYRFFPWDHSPHLVRHRICERLIGVVATHPAVKNYWIFFSFSENVGDLRHRYIGQIYSLNAFIKMN